MWVLSLGLAVDLCFFRFALARHVTCTPLPALLPPISLGFDFDLISA